MESISTPIDVAIEAGKTYWWRACGKSQSQPFCDGSRKGTTYSPLRYQAIES
jgi:CDGSH-type Zn-finger protein